MKTYTEQEYRELQEIIFNILDITDIMHGYCEHCLENKKMSPLLTLIEKIQVEIKKITEKF